MQYDKLDTSEKLVINRLLRETLSKGYWITVKDEEGMVLNQSDSLISIKNAIGNSDLTWLHLTNRAGNPAGSFMLVHGNGRDVIADYSFNNLCDYLFRWSTEDDYEGAI